jgi:hypothetical protein
MTWTNFVSTKTDSMTTYSKNLHTEAKAFSTSNATLHQTSTTQLSAYGRLIESLKFSHFGLIAMAILIGSCLGSVATMKIFQNYAPTWQFVLSLGVTMANLVACIAQAPTKWVVNLFVLSLFVNTVLLLINIF